MSSRTQTPHLTIYRHIRARCLIHAGPLLQRSRRFKIAVIGLTYKEKRCRRGLSRSVILLSGSGLTTAVNLAYNIAIAHSLAPGFGHATAVYTILTLISAVTSPSKSLRKGVAQQSSPEGKEPPIVDFHQSAWDVGSLCASIATVQRSIASI